MLLDCLAVFALVTFGTLSTLYCGVLSFVGLMLLPGYMSGSSQPLTQRSYLRMWVYSVVGLVLSSVLTCGGCYAITLLPPDGISEAGAFTGMAVGLLAAGYSFYRLNR